MENNLMDVVEWFVHDKRLNKSCDRRKCWILKKKGRFRRNWNYDVIGTMRRKSLEEDFCDDTV